MIIGQPKRIEEFPPLTPEEFAYLRQPLDQAIAQGVPMNQPATVDLMVLCRLLSTVVTLSTELKRVTVTINEAAAQQPEPMLASTMGEPVPQDSATETPEAPPLPDLPLDPSRRVNLTE
jgi:hypothetical protein